MGRKMKIFPGQVEDYLKESGDAVTIQGIADYFGICPATVRKLLRVLRKEGKSILPTNKGIIDAEKVEDEGKAKLVKDYGVWLISLLVTLAQLSQISKRPLIQAKKYLESKDDRKQLREILVVLTRTIDIIDVDHQLED